MAYPLHRTTVRSPVTTVPSGTVIADRLPRKVVMVTADLGRALSELLLATLVIVGSPPLWVFMVLAGVIGAGQAFFNPALTGLLPLIVGDDRRQQANALKGVASSTGQIIGPAAGGLNRRGRRSGMGDRDRRCDLCRQCVLPGPARRARGPGRGAGIIPGPAGDRMEGVPFADLALGHRRPVRPVPPSRVRAVHGPGRGDREHGRRRCGRVGVHSYRARPRRDLGWGRRTPHPPAATVGHRDARHLRLRRTSGVARSGHRQALSRPPPACPGLASPSSGPCGTRLCSSTSRSPCCLGSPPTTGWARSHSSPWAT